MIVPPASSMRLLRVQSSKNECVGLRRIVSSSRGGAGKRYLSLSSASAYLRTPPITTLKQPPAVVLAVLNSQQQRPYVTQTSQLLKDYPPHTIYPMPALSPTMDMGSIASWTIKEGDSFSAGDSLCTIDTDKASIDFESQDDGILAKILKQGADAVDLSIGTPICVVVEDAEDVAAFSDYTPPDDQPSQAPSPPETVVGDVSAAEQAPEPSVAAAAAAAAPAASSVTGASILMPSARHLSESKGLDATVLAGSGKGGRVTKADVMQALVDGTMPILSSAAVSSQTSSPVGTAAAAAAPPSPSTSPPQDLPLFDIETSGGYEDTPNNKMRKIIASRLTESKRDVPHFYTSVGVELDEILKLRKSLVTSHDVKISVNDFVLRCCALSLRDVPAVNATYDVSSTDSGVQLQSNIDVSVAVATPTGLITPIVFAADKLGLQQITDTVRDLATRARDGKLAPHEYQGGTFSVSNLGMFGISEFSAVINPPQAAILAVGGGTRQVVSTPYADGLEEQSKPSIRTIMTARLSADRRVVDEATASLFLSAFRHYINEPELLLL